MSIRLLFILGMLMVSTYADDKKDATKPKSNGLETKKGDKEKADDSKMKVAGLYETNKVANVKSVKGNHPVS